ncbi:hypothetical protein QT987_25715 [Microcoleus sp. SVA1B4]|uniref:hypothetical protein n=1 Tax=Microcoleus sp. B4-C5 TaxID=2818664 RepID=UPI002FD696B0
MPVPQDSFFVVERASCPFPGRAGEPVNIFLLPSSLYYTIKDSLHDDTNSTKNTNL